MRLPDPEVTATLEAVDATLAGEAVDPRYADVAELALLLQAERPTPTSGFATRLDERVARRFEADRPPRRAPARWLFAPAGGLAVAIIVAIVVLTSSGGGPSAPRPVGGFASAGAPLRHAPAGPAARAAGPKALSQAAGIPATPALSRGPAAQATGALSPALVLPPYNGRKVVQSSQLTLSAPPNRIDDVAQEVFDVVGAEHGYVNNSSVTATGGPTGYAQFQLTVPSDVLASTMTQLSELRYASVVSRTDLSNDVTDQWNSASSQVAHAQALRTSLLKQLQNAVTQTQIDAINAQLADANAKIAAAQAALRSLNHQVSDSQISLTVQARSAPAAHGSGGFTLGKAAHDAGRVLEVAAGVALIALAVLAPVGLVVALAWWVAAALRRRRREQALDLA
jgi:uncharacterized membrane protein (Fun14 family)